MFNLNKPTLLMLMVVLGAGVFVLSNKQSTTETVATGVASDGNYAMVLTEEGYEPDILYIKKGDTVTFSTTRDKHHWPASNLHPEHEIYPEFDPMRPLAPEETWSFTFDRVGTWNTHDHLRSYYRSSIVVSE